MIALYNSSIGFSGCNGIESLLGFELKKCKNQEERNKALGIYRIGAFAGFALSLVLCWVMSLFM